MATAQSRRVRVGTRLSLELRSSLTKYCAASDISERTLIEHGLRTTALVPRCFDRIERALAREHRDLKLLSEAFGRYMRLWFMAACAQRREEGTSQSESSQSSVSTGTSP